MIFFVVFTPVLFYFSCTLLKKIHNFIKEYWSNLHIKKAHYALQPGAVFINVQLKLQIASTELTVPIVKFFRQSMAY